MFSAREILNAVGGRLAAGSAGETVKGVSIDSRAVKDGDVFIAIKGPRYDGGAFVAEALSKGARGVVVSSGFRMTVLPGAFKKRFIIRCPDTLKALGRIARFHRERFDIPVAAVTGSNGKTTAKEMIGSVLRAGWAPLKNYGTENNLVGVPLTLLRLNSGHKSAIIELGMNRPSEIKDLAEMARPNLGVITNIGPSHLERLNGLPAVYRAKRELLDFLRAGDIAVLNNDDIFLRRFRKKGLRIATFGIDTKSDFRARRVKKTGDGWSFIVNAGRYFIPTPARHDIYNALAAISVGTIFNVAGPEMSAVLASYVPLEKRMASSVLRGIEFIDDTYNSNPLSMESAIRTLAERRTRGRRIIVGGDMLELGGRAAYYHDMIGGLVARSGIEGFIGVGRLMRRGFLAAKKAGMENAWHCASAEDAANLLGEIARARDVVLVKGSRAVRMEEVIKCFTTFFIR